MTEQDSRHAGVRVEISDEDRYARARPHVGHPPAVAAAEGDIRALPAGAQVSGREVQRPRGSNGRFRRSLLAAKADAIEADFQRSYRPGEAAGQRLAVIADYARSAVAAADRYEVEAPAGRAAVETALAALIDAADATVAELRTSRPQ